MNKQYSLEEDVQHGTKEEPIYAVTFKSGKGTHFPEGFSVDRHWHQEIEILYVQKGSYQIELNLETMDLHEGDICFVNSGMLHEIRGLNMNTEHETIIFDPRILGFSYEDALQVHLTGPLERHETSLPRLIRAEDEIHSSVRECCDRIMLQKNSGQDWYSYAKLEILKMLLILESHQKIVSADSMFSASEKEKIDHYKKLVSYMEAHYMDKIRLEDLADVIHCNLQYLCRIFKEIAGVSPIQYLIECRIAHARAMLTGSTRSVLEIGMDCGFDNVSYFIRQFKKCVGMTPGAYRKQTKN